MPGAAQTEAQLEECLQERLAAAGYERVTIPNERALIANLKKQIEKHNRVRLSETEFDKVLKHLSRGSVFTRAEKLRDHFHLNRDNGTPKYLRFLNTEEWCRNEFQVTSQVKIKGEYKNRYDVTILINGLPLVHIELKKRDSELKQAFNQINRYHRHSFSTGHGLYQFVQIFVISNGVNTRYFANNYRQSRKQMFAWANEDNKIISSLSNFTDHFLERCHLAKMISRYIVLPDTAEILMVLRPYQYYAVEAIVKQVQNGRDNGYIWHTTGSGKTLTSFKAAQVLTMMRKVHKVVFVVDRVDLDYQTTHEFNHFSKGSVDGTESTKALIEQFQNFDKPLIVTTIQKLNAAISRQHHEPAMREFANKRVVFIFDECHRSQFGETHQKIINYFQNAQLFGFTGTPIFADNAVRTRTGIKTTEELFYKCLHSYRLPQAIRDENVLRFSVEYWSKLRRRDGSLIDEQIKGIDTKEFFESDGRIGNVVKWIINHHSQKTQSKYFSAILAAPSIDALEKYYDAFKKLKGEGRHDLRIAAVCSYPTNEDDENADGHIPEPGFDINSPKLKRHSREKLEECISDYNKMFGTAYSTRNNQGFYAYYRDIGRRIKDRERDGFDEKDRIDILLVVNMYLTGFDAKRLNTLYVDKNLKQHGLMQAFSRTNRIFNECKSQGNIVCFRNLSEAMDKAITLFSSNDPSQDVLLKPHLDYVESFNKAAKALLKLAPNFTSVDRLQDENGQLAFVHAFRNLIRVLNVLQSFAEFSYTDLIMSEQQINDYKSKYFDLYEQTRAAPSENRVSIINDVDFELELMRRDEVNVAYILGLLMDMKNKPPWQSRQIRKTIGDLLNNEAQLRSKRQLIGKFIEENMTKVNSADKVKTVFDKYWQREQNKALRALSKEEKLNQELLDKLISRYKFTSMLPMGEAIVEALEEPPRILERRNVVTRIQSRIEHFVQQFDEGVSGA